MELADELVGDGNAVRRIAADGDLASDDGMVHLLPIGKLHDQPRKIRGAQRFLDHFLLAALLGGRPSSPLGGWGSARLARPRSSLGGALRPRLVALRGIIFKLLSRI